MILKTILFISFLSYCESAYLYSSFWAPLVDPRILNYRVDANFDPESGKNARAFYEKRYGFRGETLISGLGNGNAPTRDDQGPRDVQLVYTFPGAGHISTMIIK